MKFGPLPVAQAEGCILAHSLPLSSGRLRKGTHLTTAHLEALEHAGLSEVIVAQLEPGDLEENAAATALGQALVEGQPHLRATQAATGRVNIMATRAGLVGLDPDALARLNGINPMITLASVPELHQTHPGGMIGTLKIISYAVPSRDIDKACAAAREALKLYEPLGQEVSLIITQISPESDETKGIAALRARVEALEGDLRQITCVPHRTEALAEALSRAKGDLVLVLTGSATSDAHDVGPEALRQAGGSVTRFGMPVDPGNLLFLGENSGTCVIGLPGCARSPALNGADLVLSRVMCGLDVTGADIAAMGAGGLLKEIPTRPRPRLG